MPNTNSSTSSSNGRSPWLFGPVSDLGIGCGLLFWCFFLWMTFSGDTAQTVLPYTLAPMLALVIGHPHYGATLLRVYEHRSDRQRYFYFAVVGSGLIWTLFAVGVHVDIVGSMLLTLTFMIGPWHYSAQNYGIAMMLMRRRGAQISRPAQRFFHASFVLSTLITILSLHGPVGPREQAALYDNTGYNFISIGMQAGNYDVAVVSLALLYLASLIGAAVLLKRKATFAQLIPAAAIAVTQALWFSVPKLSSHFGWFGQVESLSIQHAAYMFFWVSVGHSIQYLWVTTYFAERAEQPTRRIPFYAKTVFAGAAIFAVPAFLFAPDIMGNHTLVGGLTVMISSAVNLHHYLLDGVIWKLRQGRIADVLIRNQAAQKIEPEAMAGWVRPALVSAGVVALLVNSVELISARFASSAVEREDAAALSGSIQTLAFIHRERASNYYNLSLMQSRQGDQSEAIESAKQTRRLRDNYNFKHTSNLCNLLAAAGRTSEAIAACRPIVDNQPDDARAAMNLALLLARDSQRTAASMEEAIALAETASALQDDNPYYLEQLASIYGMASRGDAMQRVAVRALENAHARSDQKLEERLRIMIGESVSDTTTE
jgi:tetratricopeptide (TPR) repeat protein